MCEHKAKQVVPAILDAADDVGGVKGSVHTGTPKLITNIFGQATNAHNIPAHVACQNDSILLRSVPESPRRNADIVKVFAAYVNFADNLANITDDKIVIARLTLW